MGASCVRRLERKPCGWWREHGRRAVGFFATAAARQVAQAEVRAVVGQGPPGGWRRLARSLERDARGQTAARTTVSRWASWFRSPGTLRLWR